MGLGGVPTYPPNIAASRTNVVKGTEGLNGRKLFVFLAAVIFRSLFTISLVTKRGFVRKSVQGKTRTIHLYTFPTHICPFGSSLDAGLNPFNLDRPVRTRTWTRGTGRSQRRVWKEGSTA